MDEFKILKPTDEQLAQIREWKELEAGNNPAKRIKPEVAVEKTILHGMLSCILLLVVGVAYIASSCEISHSSCGPASLELLSSPCILS